MQASNVLAQFVVHANAKIHILKQFTTCLRLESYSKMVVRLLCLLTRHEGEDNEDANDENEEEGA